MMRKVLRCVLLGMSVILGGGWAGEGARRQREVDLWNNHIRDHPNPVIVDKGSDIEVIEGMEIIQQSSGLSPLGAALSSVTFETGGVKVKDCGLSPDLFERFAREMKGAELTAKETNAIRKLAEKATGGYWARHPGIKGKVVFDKTFGIRDAKLLQMTFGREKDVVAALRKVARYHGYVPTLEHGKSLLFSDLKEAIDKKVPVLLEQTAGQFRVAVGYIADKQINYLILVDCARIPLETRPMHVTKAAQESDDPWVKAIVRRYKKKRITSDYETDTSKKLPEGMRIFPFQSVAEMKAYMVYDWRVSPGPWAKDIARILKIKRRDTLPEWLK
jgi:hypothetical protein